MMTLRHVGYGPDNLLLMLVVLDLRLAINLEDVILRRRSPVQFYCLNIYSTSHKLYPIS